MIAKWSIEMIKFKIRKLFMEPLQKTGIIKIIKVKKFLFLEVLYYSKYFEFFITLQQNYNKFSFDIFQLRILLVSGKQRR